MLSTFNFADDIVGIIVKDDVHSEKLDEIHAEIAQRLEIHHRISLYFELEEGNDISFMSLLKDLKFKFEHIGEFRKMAVVTNVTWFNTVIAAKDLLMECEVRIFKNKERLEALKWIAQ